MLTRLYVDNYKRLVNFDYRPGQIQLLMGGNGSGKSSVFQCLQNLRAAVVDRRPVLELFPDSSRCRWVQNFNQTFHLEVALGTERFRYELKVQHSPPGMDNDDPVTLERLSVESGTLFEFKDGVVQQFSDAHVKGASFAFEMSGSAFGAFPSRPPDQRATAFRNWLSSLLCIKPSPSKMRSRAEGDVRHPNSHLSDFVAWYYHLVLETPEGTVALRDDLRRAISGFETLFLKDRGSGTRQLRARFRVDPSAPESGEPSAMDLSLAELSDGQRVLVALYTLLHCGLRKGATLCIDEPDNYIALREIQPWLMALQDRAIDQDSQVLLISHHPELLNQLAADYGQVFVIRGSGGVTVEPYKGTGTGLSPSEEIAGGWDRD